MRKLAMQIGDDLIQEARPRARWPKVLCILFLLVGFAPLAVEGGALCLGQWKEALGGSSDVRTPTIDRVQESLHDLSDTLWGQITPWFRAVPWEPKMVLPVGAIVMGIAMMMLRR